MKKHSCAALLAVIALACVPKRDLQPDQIASLGKLSEVMQVQATVADPQFNKIGETAYTDADWTAFADVGTRIQATSAKAKAFSKGPEFDALSDRLGEKAKTLSAAARVKDAKAASDALEAMRATCKECHSKFR
jgi:cytochrome c556